MTRLHYLALAAALPLAAFVSWQLGGSVGAGAMLGAVAALALCTGGLAWQDWALRNEPKSAMTALVATFLAKLAALTGGTIALRFGGGAAEHFGWRAYLLGFICASLWAMAIGSLRHVRAKAEVRAS